MMQIRKRWPILTALVAALAYGFNNYQLAGLEHLRLQPRAAIYGSPAADSGQAASPLGFDLSESAYNGDIFGQAPSPFQFENVPPWNDKLTLGEKLSLWQEGRGNQHETSATRLPESNVPFVSPIPSPIDLGLNIADSGSAAQVAYPNLLPPVSANALPTTITQPVRPPLPTESRSAGLPSGSFVAKPNNLLSSPGSNPLAAANRIRVASFNLGGLGPAKLAKPHVLELLVRIIRQYDVVALQEVRSSRDDILPILVERLNQSGRSYDYLIGPRVGRQTPRDQFAFVFDTNTLETDRYQLYTVDDPEDLMAYDPLVAWFRCKGVAKDKAFTFSLVNIHIDPRTAAAEQALLPNLISAIESDGRAEDDWILLGDFEGSSTQLSTLNTESVRFGIRDIPTDVAGQRMLDTMVFSSRGTNEFMGRSGAFDFLRKYNLSLENALEVSDHLPIWAEFSIMEGNEPGRIAPIDPQTID